MKPIESIPTAELRRDLADVLLYIALREKELAAGIDEYSGVYSTRERLEMNERVCELIEAELARRGEASVVVLNTRLNTRDERSTMTGQEYLNYWTETEAVRWVWDGVTLGHDGQLVEAVCE